jgi:hypothetical protein
MVMGDAGSRPGQSSAPTASCWAHLLAGAFPRGCRTVPSRIQLGGFVGPAQLDVSFVIVVVVLVGRPVPRAFRGLHGGRPGDWAVVLENRVAAPGIA